jgi:hypothetical protein
MELWLMTDLIVYLALYLLFGILLVLDFPSPFKKDNYLNITLFILFYPFIIAYALFTCVALDRFRFLRRPKIKDKE